METLDAITKRRSIRKFQNKVVPKEIIEQLIDLSTKAPSGKNRQPWRFLILQRNKKEELVNLITRNIQNRKEKGLDVGSCQTSAKAMNEAPVVILVFNPFSRNEEDYNHYRLLTDTQSIGAAIQTMLLAAKDLGLGSLWICDIFYMHYEICSWLNRDDELVAAVALGYGCEEPYPRPRKSRREVAEWMG
ncbi:nitroreductase family protein [Vallitalea okinawensis]|uniref:nitroreductase family protein n=1 Tax=Vallitalea okinawensis TaxID=2078660 RepID=UPI000CFA9D89|nr:nitroreductase [Vallitalea okinawensis]